MKKFEIIFGLLFLTNNFSWAVGSAGYANQVLGSRAYGMGNSFAGLADDPTAVYFNPAGITQLDRYSMSYGVTVEPLSSSYTPASGTKEDMKSFTPVVPHFYTVIPTAGQKISFGFGINSPYGLETHWKEDGQLRYVATDSRIAMVNFNPEIAYKINDQASVAAGIVYGYVRSATLKKRINNTVLNGYLETFLGQGLGVFGDGNQKLSGNGDGWGYNFGFLLKPTDRHSFGISYRSEIREQIDGKVELTNLSGPNTTFLFGGNSYTANAKTELKQPESLLLGYAFKPGKWSFVSDAEWVGNKSINQTELIYEETNALRSGVLNTGNPIPRKWHDTWNFGFGGNYKFNDMWEARAGYFHFASAISNATWDPSLPESSRDGYTLGGSFNLPSFSIDLLYNYVKFDNRTVNNTVGSSVGTTVNGEYKTSAHIFAATITHRFGGKRS